MHAYIRSEQYFEKLHLYVKTGHTNIYKGIYIYIFARGFKFVQTAVYSDVSKDSPINANWHKFSKSESKEVHNYSRDVETNEDFFSIHAKTKTGKSSRLPV